MVAQKAFEEALARRNLSINAAHMRLGISREALTKMSYGQPTALEIVERFARGLGESVNQWRQLYGHPPVEPDPGASVVAEEREPYRTPRQALLEGMERLEQRFPDVELRWPRFQGGLGRATMQQVLAELARLESECQQLASESPRGAH